MRIIAGSAKGRALQAPGNTKGVRPTADRVRETLFNVLGQWMDGLAVLDLFAGTGALALEALSRGATRAVLVDVDTSLAAYKAAEFKAGMGSPLRLVRNGIRAFRKGFRQVKTQGDAFQLGGVLVVDRGGNVLFYFASREAGDHPPIADIHAALAHAAA